MKVKFSRVNAENISNVPQTDGQLIYTKDTGDAYIDVGDKRTKLSDIIFIDTLDQRNAIATPFTNKLYYVAETNFIYRYNGTEWVEPKTSAVEAEFDNTETTLEATNTQEAIVELDTKIGDVSALLDKINGETSEEEV